MPNFVSCQNCGRVREHCAKQLCRSCYEVKNGCSRKRIRQYTGVHLDYIRRTRAGFWPGLVPALRTLQRGACALCPKILGPGRAEQADHCHKTNQPRGLLCVRCNVQLGFYEKLKSDGACYPRFDAYLNEPPAAIIWEKQHEQNFDLRCEVGE